LRIGLIAGLIAAVLGAPLVLLAGGALKAASDAFLDLPSELIDRPAAQASYVYAADGTTLITDFYEEYRHYVPMSELGETLPSAVVAAEDTRFFQHNGVDAQGMVRAFVANQRSGGVQQGGSTLTMQYVRMALRDNARTPEDVVKATEQTRDRKIREMRLALAVEHRLSKEEILERYLNGAYFGHRAYGAFAAAQIYFSKEPKDLTVAEAAMLAGLVKAPTDYDPAANDPATAKDRRDYVLREMAKMGRIDAAEVVALQQEPVRLNVYEPPNDCLGVAPEHNDMGFFCDFFKTWWIAQPAFGQNPQQRLDNLRRGGYRIVTSIDPRLQGIANRRVLQKEPVTSSYAHGVVAIQPGTGLVEAMAVNRVYSIDQSHNGRSTDPRAGGRGGYPNTVAPLLGGGELPGYQAGSTFKLFTMLAAIEHGMPLSTSFNAPRRYTSIYPGTPGEGSTCGNKWCPSNASDAMTGTQNMRTGFGKSVNTYFVQLEQAVGSQNAVKMAERLGLRWRSPVDAALAGDPVRASLWGAFTLGVADTTPLEMANAYATVAAEGIYCEPIPVLSITGPDGKALPAAAPRCHEELMSGVAKAATDAARCVTGYGAASGDCGGWSTAPGVYGAVGRPVAGKTGTTDDTRAAWFIGFTPQLCAASFIADPDYPFHYAGDGNSQKPVNTVAEVLRDGLAGQPVAYFGYP
jgi:membrane peptidoglycan carboxypeptidase